MYKYWYKKLFPFAGVVIAMAVQLLVRNSSLHPAADKPYFNFVLYFFLGLTVILFGFSFASKKLSTYLEKNGIFWLGVGIFVAVLNLLTGKLAVFPPLLFPSLDNIFSVFAQQWSVILKCIFFSFRLLFVGLLIGISVGFVTGLFLGFSKKVFFWLNPVMKVIGPIPATAWIPIVLTAFPTTFQASAFIIALSVWFPVVMMTSSGIQNISKAYFEVGRTLGAGRLIQILRIGVPASLPSIFQGIFYGVCSAFIALMTAEMFGAKYGLGWFISWQKSMMMYKGVYAGLILIAVFCSVILTLLTVVRKRLLLWQKDQVL